MVRGAPSMDSVRSFINWPTNMEDTGEGGMAVFLVVPDDCDTMTEACVNLPILRQSDVYTEGQALESMLWPDSNRYKPTNEIDGLDSVELLAIVCLGTTGGAWHDDDYGYFKATEDDLTVHGQVLFGLLEQLYGRKPIFLTALDT